MKRRILILLGIAVSIGAMAWSMRNVRMADLKAGVLGADYSTLPLLLLLFVFYWLKALRWKWLLRPTKELTTAQLFRPVMIGFAANSVLPAHLGEFVRVYVVNRRHGVPSGTVLSTIVLERILDVIAILLLFGVGLLYAPSMPPEYQQGAVIFAGLASAVVLVASIYLIWTDWFIRTIEKLLSFVPFLPAGLTRKLFDLLRQGAAGLHSMRSIRTVLLALLNSLAQWSLNGLSAVMALRAFQVDVDFSTGLILTGITAFGVMIPAAPGYFGVIQLCFEAAMQAQKLQPPAALVFGASVYSQLAGMIPVVLTGFYFLYKDHLSLSGLQQAAEERDDQGPDKNCQSATDGTAAGPTGGW
ncbi:MAG: lysylphosphatidylglycerol synthase transmembrane domain-containing protein [Planctomycetaceae bacterium]